MRAGAGLVGVWMVILAVHGCGIAPWKPPIPPLLQAARPVGLLSTYCFVGSATVARSQQVVASNLMGNTNSAKSKNGIASIHDMIMLKSPKKGK